MEKKTMLLPHWCQKMGWWFLGVWALLASSFVLYIEMYGHDPEFAINPVNILGFLVRFPFVGLMFVCLSQESEEDEYIQYIRTRSLMWVVVVMFIANIFQSSISYTMLAFCPVSTISTYSIYTSWLSSSAFMALLYVILFKGSKIIDLIKSKANGE